MEWWIIDRRSDQVVSVALTSRPGGPNLSTFRNSEHLYATTTPTQAQMEGYRYFWERP